MRPPTPKPPTIPFTADAYARLQKEFDGLTRERVEVMKRLQTAREMGDLSENGAYQYAKFELGSIGRQLRQLKYVLSNGQVTAKKLTNDVVSFGCTVTLINKSKELKFLLVSQHESNPAIGKLSIESPIGQAIVGKKKGDEVVVKSPAGEVIYTISDIT